MSNPVREALEAKCSLMQILPPEYQHTNQDTDSVCLRLFAIIITSYEAQIKMQEECISKLSQVPFNQNQAQKCPINGQTIGQKTQQPFSQRIQTEGESQSNKLKKDENRRELQDYQNLCKLIDQSLIELSLKGGKGGEELYFENFVKIQVEFKRRISQLESSVNKAKETQASEDNLKNEINELKEKNQALTELTQTNENLKLEIEDLKKEIDKKKGQTAIISSSVIKLDADLKETKLASQKMNEELEKIKQENTSLNEKIKENQQREAQILQTNKQSTQKLKQISAKLQKFSQEQKKIHLEQSIKNQQDRIKIQQRRKITQQCKAWLEEIQRQDQQQDQQIAKTEITDSKQRVQSEISMKKTFQQIQTTENQFQKKFQDKIRKLQETVNQKDLSEQKLSIEISQLKDKIAGKDKSEEKLKSQISQLQAKILEKDQELKKLKEELQKIKQQNVGLQASIKDNQQKTTLQITNLKQTIEKETSLRESIQSIKAKAEQNRDSLQDENRQLKETVNQKGLSNEKLQTEISQLKHSITEKDKYEEKLKFQLNQYQTKILKKDQELCKLKQQSNELKDNLFKKNQSSSEKQGFDIQINQLREEILKLKESLLQKEQLEKKMNEECKKYRTQLTEYDLLVQDQKVELAKFRSEQDHLEQTPEICQLKASLAQKAQQVETLSSKIFQMQAQQQQLRKGLQTQGNKKENQQNKGNKEKYSFKQLSNQQTQNDQIIEILNSKLKQLDSSTKSASQSSLAQQSKSSFAVRLLGALIGAFESELKIKDDIAQNMSAKYGPLLEQKEQQVRAMQEKLKEKTEQCKHFVAQSISFRRQKEQIDGKFKFFKEMSQIQVKDIKKQLKEKNQLIKQKEKEIQSANTDKKLSVREQKKQNQQVEQKEKEQTTQNPNQKGEMKSYQMKPPEKTKQVMQWAGTQKADNSNENIIEQLRKDLKTKLTQNQALSKECEAKNLQIQSLKKQIGQLAAKEDSINLSMSQSQNQKQKQSSEKELKQENQGDKSLFNQKQKQKEGDQIALLTKQKEDLIAQLQQSQGRVMDMQMKLDRASQIYKMSQQNQVREKQLLQQVSGLNEQLSSKEKNVINLENKCKQLQKLANQQKQNSKKTEESIKAQEEVKKHYWQSEKEELEREVQSIRRELQNRDKDISILEDRLHASEKIANQASSESVDKSKVDLRLAKSAQEILSLNNEIEALNKMIQSMKQQGPSMQDLKKNNQRLLNQSNQMINQLSKIQEIQDLLKKEVQNVEKLKNQNEQLKKTIEDQNKKTEKFQKENAESIKKLEQMENEFKKTRQDLQDIKGANKYERKQNAKKDQLLKEKDKLLDEKEDERKKLDFHKAQLMEKLAKSEQKVQRMTKMNQLEGKHIQSLENLRKANVDKIGTLQKAMLQVTKSLQDSQKKTEDSRKELNEFKKSLREQFADEQKKNLSQIAQKMAKENLEGRKQNADSLAVEIIQESTRLNIKQLILTLKKEQEAFDRQGQSSKQSIRLSQVKQKAMVTLVDKLFKQQEQIAKITTDNTALTQELNKIKQLNNQAQTAYLQLTQNRDKLQDIAQKLPNIEQELVKTNDQLNALRPEIKELKGKQMQLNKELGKSVQDNKNLKAQLQQAYEKIINTEKKIQILLMQKQKIEQRIPQLDKLLHNVTIERDELLQDRNSSSQVRNKYLKEQGDKLRQKYRQELDEIVVQMSKREKEAMDHIQIKKIEVSKWEGLVAQLIKLVNKLLKSESSSVAKLIYDDTQNIKGNRDKVKAWVSSINSKLSESKVVIVDEVIKKAKQEKNKFIQRANRLEKARLKSDLRPKELGKMTE